MLTASAIVEQAREETAHSAVGRQLRRLLFSEAGIEGARLLVPREPCDPGTVHQACPRRRPAGAAHASCAPPAPNLTTAVYPRSVSGESSSGRPSTVTQTWPRNSSGLPIPTTSRGSAFARAR